MVLTNVEGNVLASDEEGTTIIEAVDGSGAVLTEMTIEIAGEVTQIMKLGRKGIHHAPSINYL